jgi:hypothetical protein
MKKRFIACLCTFLMMSNLPVGYGSYQPAEPQNANSLAPVQDTETAGEEFEDMKPVPSDAHSSFMEESGLVLTKLEKTMAVKKEEAKLSEQERKTVGDLMGQISAMMVKSDESRQEALGQLLVQIDELIARAEKDSVEAHREEAGSMNGGLEPPDENPAVILPLPDQPGRLEPMKGVLQRAVLQTSPVQMKAVIQSHVRSVRRARAKKITIPGQVIPSDTKPAVPDESSLSDNETAGDTGDPDLGPRITMIPLEPGGGVLPPPIIPADIGVNDRPADGRTENVIEDQKAVPAETSQERIQDWTEFLRRMRELVVRALNYYSPMADGDDRKAKGISDDGKSVKRPDPEVRRQYRESLDQTEPWIPFRTPFLLPTASAQENLQPVRGRLWKVNADLLRAGQLIQAEPNPLIRLMFLAQLNSPATMRQMASVQQELERMFLAAQEARRKKKEDGQDQPNVRVLYRPPSQQRGIKPRTYDLTNLLQRGSEKNFRLPLASGGTYYCFVHGKSSRPSSSSSTIS